jgi:hypothetical protein
MDINVKVTIDAAPEFMAVLQGFLKTVGQPSIPAPAATSTGKLRKADKTADKPAESEPVTSGEPAISETDSDSEKTTAPTVTIEQIRALIPEKKAQVGTDKLKALLNKYNTANVTNLPADKYDQFYNELKSLAA